MARAKLARNASKNPFCDMSLTYTTVMLQLERKLRAALAGTSEDPPRPITSIELPMRLDKVIAPLVFKRLRPASVLVPVMRRKDGLRVLLTLRSETMPSHRGQISFPGGRRQESDASAAAAAKREAEEETGIPPEAVEVIGYLDDYPTISKYMVTPVVGLVEDVPEVKPCAREVAQIFEVPLTFLLDPDNYERKILSRDGFNVPFFELNYQSWRIWGATAGMLRNLSQRVARHEG
jgi:8-oxo-dGTP pyrophosphatase MutT (NUDIX family)